MTGIHEIIAPRCAVCGRPVDRIRCEYDPFFRTFHFIAECHGKIEECDLDERLVMNADRIEPGEAFAGERMRIDQRAKRLEDRCSE